MDIFAQVLQAVALTGIGFSLLALLAAEISDARIDQKRISEASSSGTSRLNGPSVLKPAVRRRAAPIPPLPKAA